MNLFRLSLANLRNQALSTVLTLLLLTLGVGTIVVLWLLGMQLKSQMERDLRGIDLVVGAKGSPLQLILSSIYHVDIPTGNIPIAQAELIAKNPLVAATIPLALGDSIQGARIVGTTPDYLRHYGAELASGVLWSAPLEAVLGAEVAARTQFKLGDTFIGNHGLEGAGMGHEKHPYRIVGFLKPSGTVIDRLVLTSVDSVHKVHEGMATMNPAAPALAGAPTTSPDQEITALLVKYRTPLAAVTLPRMVNAQSALQAASPAMEAGRLTSLFGVGIKVLQGFAYVLIAVAALSIFVALYSALQKRQFDLAMMRVLGASRLKVMWSILLEGLWLGIAGALLGIAFGHLAAQGVALWLGRTQHVFFSGAAWSPMELWLLLLALVGVVAALIPAIQAYRLDIVRVLAESR